MRYLRELPKGIHFDAISAQYVRNSSYIFTPVRIVLIIHDSLTYLLALDGYGQ